MVSGSTKLGKALRDAYHEGTGIPYSNYLGKNAIDRRDDLGGLNMSKVPKVFIECGNMQNKSDAAKLSSSSFRQRIADSSPRASRPTSVNWESPPPLRFVVPVRACAASLRSPASTGMPALRG